MRVKKEQELREAFKKLPSYLIELGDADFGVSVDEIGRELFSDPGLGRKRVAVLREILQSILAPHNGGTNEYSFDRSPGAAAKNREYRHALEIVQGFAFGAYLNFLRPQPKFRLGSYES